MLFFYPLFFPLDLPPSRPHTSLSPPAFLLFYFSKLVCLRREESQNRWSRGDFEFRFNFIDSSPSALLDNYNTCLSKYWCNVLYWVTNLYVITSTRMTYSKVQKNNSVFGVNTFAYQLSKFDRFHISPSFPKVILPIQWHKTWLNFSLKSNLWVKILQDFSFLLNYI